MSPRRSSYRPVAEAAWRWVLDQVREDDGPWIPQDPSVTEPAYDRDGLHSGIGGLAHVLEEVRLSRPWTPEEARLADAVAGRLRARITVTTDCTLFDGLAGTAGALLALGADGTDEVLERLATIAVDGGWPQTALGPPRYLPETRIHDATLGTAGVLLAALWARRRGVSGAEPVVDHAVAVLLAEAEHLPTGTGWRWVPERHDTEPGARQMPNWSHGQAGIAGALAVAGAELDRPDLVEAAMSGAEHLVTLADTSREGFVAPMTVPDKPGQDPVAFTWCHGPTGTSLLFAALDHAGAADIAGEPPAVWHRRCLHSVRTSGLPERLRPGFWDNDGRCCGTAGVAEVFLDSWQRTGEPDDLAFALHLADTLVERAVLDGPHAYWRFLEHRAPEPLLPPGVGWMQGAAGMAATLFRCARVVENGRAADPVPRADTWWAVRP